MAERRNDEKMNTGYVAEKYHDEIYTSDRILYMRLILTPSGSKVTYFLLPFAVATRNGLTKDSSLVPCGEFQYAMKLFKWGRKKSDVNKDMRYMVGRVRRQKLRGAGKWNGREDFAYSTSTSHSTVPRFAPYNAGVIFIGNPEYPLASLRSMPP